MATFKVGQRVKRITNPGDPTLGPQPGQEGVVSEPRREGMVWVRFDQPYQCTSSLSSGDPYGCEPDTIAPLTDEKAEQFLASIRNMKPYEEPTIRVYPKETV